MAQQSNTLDLHQLSMNRRNVVQTMKAAENRMQKWKRKQLQIQKQQAYNLIRSNTTIVNAHEQDDDIVEIKSTQNTNVMPTSADMKIVSCNYYVSLNNCYNKKNRCKQLSDKHRRLSHNTSNINILNYIVC